MASDLSLFLGNKIVRWLGGNPMPAAPANLFLALYNGDPKAAGVEVTTTIRPAGRLPAVWTVPAVGVANTLVSSADVDFGLAAAAADITHVAAFDAASAGNLFAAKALAAPASAIVGTAVKLLAGDVAFVIGT